MQQLMQRGHFAGGHWVIEHDLETPRHPEPLMGWSASDDTLNQVKLNFQTLEEAEAFAKKQGWYYTIQPADKRRVQPKSYLDNFKLRGDKDPT
jgi:hypothetical protein